jgi:hypothetical protein
MGMWSVIFAITEVDGCVPAWWLGVAAAPELAGDT